MKALLSLLVPSYILEHFEYEKIVETTGVVQIYLTEKSDPNHIPKEVLGNGKAVLNGFMNPLELQTFPTKGKEIYIVLLRRRWKIPGVSDNYFNNYIFHKEGMKSTKEFGAFLKEIGRR